MLIFNSNNTKIIVGENSKENTYITSFADPCYGFMHISNESGPHIIICQKEELSKELKKDAAVLAIHYSNKKTHLKKYFVDFVRINQIQVKSSYGKVLLTNPQKLTIFINKERQRLDKLLQTKTKEKLTENTMF